MAVAGLRAGEGHEERFLPPVQDTFKPAVGALACQGHQQPLPNELAANALHRLLLRDAFILAGETRRFAPALSPTRRQQMLEQPIGDRFPARVGVGHG